ncbi:MAG: hypothetical protein EPO26_11500 [Chloroflexota bacterium]|nr:MAG: hypothetical protein EPO26_11500 [Chloroflexota bacterium]
MAIIVGGAAGWLSIWNITLPVAQAIVAVAGIALILSAMFGRTDLLVPTIIITTPIEISKLWIPILKAPSSWYGYDVSLLDVGRVSIVLALGLWLARSMVIGRVTFARGKIPFLAIALVGFAIVSLVYTFDPIRGRNEALRLFFNLALMFVVARFSRSEGRVYALASVWMAVASILSIVALWQYTSSVSFWNPQLQEGATRRINATFADPNTFASFLNVAALFGVCLLATRRERPAPWSLGLGLSLAGLVVTYSRSGWLAFAIGVAVWGILFARGARALALFGLFLIGAVAVLIAVPSIGERLATLDSYDNLSVRPWLIQAGLTIFGEHPIGGLGIGSFQLAVATDYAWAYPFWWYVTASHTSFVTTLAELGIVGMTITLLLLAAALYRAWGIACDKAQTPRTRGLARGALLGIVVLVIAGQTIGALFEEPYIWMLLGALMVLGRSGARQRLGEDALAPVDDRLA